MALGSSSRRGVAVRSSRRRESVDIGLTPDRATTVNTNPFDVTMNETEHMKARRGPRKTNLHKSLSTIMREKDLRSLEAFCQGRTYQDVINYARGVGVDLEELEELLMEI